MKKEDPTKVLSPQELAELYKTFDYETHTLSVKEFVAAAQQPNTHIFDLRGSTTYQRGHMQGAVHLGADVTLEILQQLAPDKNATILVYCTNSFEPTRMMALTLTLVPQIYALGYQNVYLLEEIWKSGLDKKALALLPWEGEK